MPFIICWYGLLQALTAFAQNISTTLQVGVLRLQIPVGPDGLPDRFFMPAIVVAGRAYTKLHPNTTFNFVEYYPLTVPCAQAGGTVSASSMFMKVYNYALGQTVGSVVNPPVHAVIGPYCSAKVIPAAIAATTTNIVQVTGGGEDIADITSYTRLARTGYAKQYQFDIIIKYLVPKYQWVNFAVIYDMDTPPMSARDYASIQAVLVNYPSLVVNYLLLAPGTDNYASSISASLTEAGTNARLVVLLMNNTLLRQTLLQAAALDMTDGSYVFFALDQFGMTILPTGPGYGWNVAGDSANAAAMAAYSTLLVIGIKDYSGNSFYQDNMDAVKAESTNATYNLAQYPFPTDNSVLYFMSTFYNAVLFLGNLALYANTVGNFSVAPANLSTTLSTFMNMMFTPPFPYGSTLRNTAGFNGPYTISTVTSDLRESYQLYTMSDTTNGVFTAYIEYNGVFDNYTVLNPNFMWMLWSNGSFPFNVPRCGFQNESDVCKAELMAEILAGILVPVVLVLVALGFRVYRRRHRIDLDEKWLAHMSEMRVIHPENAAALIEEAKRAREALMEENYSIGASQVGSLSEKLMSPNVGYWKKQAVIVRWSKKKTVKMSAKMAAEVRETTEVTKENISRLLGICLEPNKILLLYEYCSRGSIEESVNDPESKFEWPLRFSYINDIIRGMYFIHTTSIKVHGRLSSACCFIDSRFTVKICDAGMASFFEMNLVEYWIQKRRPDFYYRELWTAPEILRERENNVDEVVNTATREGDTFSFSIILQEIIVHGPPYSMYDDSYTDQRIYETVSKHPAPGGKPFRPIIDESLAHIEIIRLCEKCWSESASERPSFSQIRVIMKEITKNLGMGDRLNIMEALIQQMEEHTMGLQAMIEEKEKLILEEKARADFLLYSNLPPAYGEALRTGEPVRPIYFEVCSIAVVDIENFDAITAVSTAPEIARLLTNLHYYYSEGTESFDCILLESIMQRVTVASGVPIRNGILHAREVARLALTLLYRSNEFIISHLPEQHIAIRFGIHSGPIVSGVVGRRVPRFCLFGETLNVATRIMTVEKPLRIRMSSASRNIIEAFGSFRAFDAGDVYVKGKGRLKTYTLTGEDGNHDLMELKRKFGADSLLEFAH